MDMLKIIDVTGIVHLVPPRRVQGISSIQYLAQKRKISTGAIAVLVVELGTGETNYIDLSPAGVGSAIDVITKFNSTLATGDTMVPYFRGLEFAKE